mmetsp:Transcript_5006/g.10532  ORF Transcript_5006/g.10532 Transcript_5006/m.10532 type:complete len:227 (-) Transcript_5006:697-1377(-)
METPFTSRVLSFFRNIENIWNALPSFTRCCPRPPSIFHQNSPGTYGAGVASTISSSPSSGPPPSPDVSPLSTSIFFLRAAMAVGPVIDSPLEIRASTSARAVPASAACAAALSAALVASFAAADAASKASSSTTCLIFPDAFFAIVPFFTLLFTTDHLLVGLLAVLVVPTIAGLVSTAIEVGGAKGVAAEGTGRALNMFLFSFIATSSVYFSAFCSSSFAFFLDKK